MKAFCSWSGGKESTFALYKAKGQGISPHQKFWCGDIDISCLLNMISEDGKYSRSHGVSSGVLKKQAECIGIPLLQVNTSWQDYEKEFKKAVSSLNSIDAGIFGDIDLQEHRDWVERVCKDLGIMPILPLWNENQESLLREFIKSGFKAVLIATRADLLREDWLGRLVDEKFISDLKTLGNIDLCGEKGEYHTFVFKGPIFKKAVEITLGEKVLRDNYWFLEIK